MKTLMLIVAVGVFYSSPYAQAAVRAFVSQDDGSFQNVIGAPGVDSVLASLPAKPITASGPVGPVSFSANSTTGQLRALAENSSGVAGAAEGSAQLSDTVFFHVAGTDSATVVFNGFLRGIGVGSGPFGGSYVDLNLLAEFNGTSVRSIGVFYAPSAHPSVCESLPSSVSFCKIGTTVAERMELPVLLPPGDTSIKFSATLFGDAAPDATFDIWNTASIWLSVPDGVAVTPSTLGFLSAATPVPEPLSYALMLSGLALLALVPNGLKAWTFNQPSTGLPDHG